MAPQRQKEYSAADRNILQQAASILGMERLQIPEIVRQLGSGQQSVNSSGLASDTPPSGLTSNTPVTGPSSASGYFIEDEPAGRPDSEYTFANVGDGSQLTQERVLTSNGNVDHSLIDWCDEWIDSVGNFDVDSSHPEFDNSVPAVPGPWESQLSVRGSSAQTSSTITSGYVEQHQYGPETLFPRTSNHLRQVSHWPPVEAPATCSFHVPEQYIITDQDEGDLDFADASNVYTPSSGHSPKNGIDLTRTLAPPATPAKQATRHRRTQTKARRISGVSKTSNDGRKVRVRQPFKDEAMRAETGETRKLKACIRCFMQRVRCHPDPSDPHGPCATCKGVVGPTLSHLPCLRYKITDSKLFDKGSHPQFLWSERWKSMKVVELDDWRTPEIRRITVTQDVRGAQYELFVREFNPTEGDALQRYWKTNGQQMSYTCAPYAIVNMKKTGEMLLKYVDDNIQSSLEHYLNPDDKLIWTTYKMALQQSLNAETEEERILLRQILRLWTAVRMESRSERICGQDTLGMSPQDYDPSVNNYGHVPLPPVMSAQIELVMTAMVLNPLRTDILRRLGHQIKANKMRSWFNTYLCLFVLLHSCALLTNFQTKQAQKYGLRARYIYGDFVEELHMGSRTLLAFFHYCNKGAHPFSLNWELPVNISLGDLNAEKKDFLQFTRAEVNRLRPTFERIEAIRQFENDYFFLCQMYNPEWRPW